MSARLRLTLIFGVLGMLGAAYWWRATSAPVPGSSESQGQASVGAQSSPARPAYVDSMKSALRNLAVVQEAYFAEHSRYAGSLEELQQGAGGYYRATSGVSVVVQGTPTGWSAVASSAFADTTCTMTMATGGPEDGVPKC